MQQKQKIMAGNEATLKKDFLVKRSQMKSIITSENYKGRWFELTSRSLRYSNGSLESGIGKVKGQIRLDCIRAVEDTESEHLGNRENAFQVVYNMDEHNILYIMCPKENQKTEWMLALRNASVQAGARFSEKYHPGVWLCKARRFSCCDSINKRSQGCRAATSTFRESVGSQEINDPTITNNVIQSYTQRFSDDSGNDTVSRLNSILRPLPPPPIIRVNAPKLIALYNYKAVEEADLDLIKGEEYYLVGDSSKDTSWWQAQNKEGRIGYVPVNYVQEIREAETRLEQYDWFYPNTSRTQSEEILSSDGREGVFLVRESSQSEFKYTLSVYTRSGCGPEPGISKHYHIKETPEGEYYLADKHPFKTIPELIYYHKHNCAGLIVRLRFPPGDRNSMKPACGLGHNLTEIDFKLLDIKEELGCGQFGKVYRGLYVGTVEVAVKMMKEGSMQEEDFIEEAKTMMNLQHENLVKLYGVCTKRPILILTEFMKNGALLQHLRRHKVRLLANVETLVDMCTQVCSAMCYLERHNIIHRDLAARNCLVGEANKVKVGDFGLARFVLDNEYTSSAGAKFPVKWSAPEVLNYTRFSSKSDVWAYGILMWEIFSGGESPYGRAKNVEVVDGVCNRDQRLLRPPKCPENIFFIMYSCWNKNAEERPAFNEIFESLRLTQADKEYVD